MTSVDTHESEPSLADTVAPPARHVARFVYRGKTGALIGRSSGIKDAAEARKVVESLRRKAAALS
ncbi:hypothetical protein FDO65_19850 [Nakamurella flava]|uniref:Uncharacterized protein n=1 Tax=Nakamurella flava TaxID=2576308 RepID=A0A4U6QB02_9ACTN|nr:hypothetical protein [Nakamurella flava]TKV57066.1 hypothetical protein FDO65_19850 [Nakamurella flava]